MCGDFRGREQPLRLGAGQRLDRSTLARSQPCHERPDRLLEGVEVAGRKPAAATAIDALRRANLIACNDGEPARESLAYRQGKRFVVARLQKQVRPAVQLGE